MICSAIFTCSLLWVHTNNSMVANPACTPVPHLVNSSANTMPAQTTTSKTKYKYVVIKPSSITTVPSPKTPSWKFTHTPVTVFTVEVGPKHPLTACILPIFKMLFTTTLMQTIVEPTFVCQTGSGYRMLPEMVACNKRIGLGILWLYHSVSIKHLSSLMDYW